MKHIGYTLITVLFGLALSVPGIGAQQTRDVDLVADTLPLTGVQNLTLGTPAPGYSFLLPSFGVATSVQVNPYNTTQASQPDFIALTYATARLGLNHTSGRSNLALDYLAGGAFSTDSNHGNSGIQFLNFSDMVHWGRWSTIFGDQLSYASQSPFAFGGLGGLSNLGVGLGNGLGTGSEFRPGFLPNQSVLISGSPEVSNAAIGEVDYALSHRSSLTFAGSYGTLNFVENGFKNSSNATFQCGLNHLLDRRNSIAVFYRLNEVTFSDLSQSFGDHSVQFTYGRRITGRLSFQVGAGPSVLVYHLPLAGSSTVASWMASASLKFQHRHMGAGFNYDHSITAGSGILAGATTDLFSGFLNQTLGRNWEGSVLSGYSRNQALPQTTPNATNIGPQTWFVLARASRHFVRYASLYVSYGASGQTSLAGICTLPACQASALTHTVSIGYNWGLRPVLFQ